MKKINKGFFFYLGILLAIAVAAFLICVVIIVLSPGTSIFGLKYYNVKQTQLLDTMTIYSPTQDEEGNTVYQKSGSAYFKNYKDQISKVVIISNAHSVSIKKVNKTYQNPDQWHVYVTNSTSGFTTDETTSATMEAKYYTDTKTFEISANVPTGFWVTGNSSSITMQIPTSVNEALYEFEIQAGSGSVSLGDVKTSNNTAPNTLNLRCATISASSLGITQYAVIGAPNSSSTTKLDISGTISTSSTIYAKELEIKTGSGISNFNTDGVAFDANKISIQTQSSTSNYGRVDVDDCLNLKNTYGTQNFGTVNGAIKIDAESRKCDYNFDHIIGNLTVGQAEAGETPEKKAENCNIVLKQPLGGYSDIHTTGTVTIPE